jgi:hypothetical protein
MPAAIGEIKFCAKCKDYKFLDEFGKDRNAKDGHYLYCLECRGKIDAKNYAKMTAEQREGLNERNKRWRRSNPDKYRRVTTACRRKREYKLLDGDYEQMLAEQNGLCAICQKPETKKVNGRVVELSVDHNHITGEIRKLLCQKCNLMIGYSMEDPGTLEAAAKYLRQHTQAEAVKE